MKCGLQGLVGEMGQEGRGWRFGRRGGKELSTKFKIFHCIIKVRHNTIRSEILYQKNYQPFLSIALIPAMIFLSLLLSLSMASDSPEDNRLSVG